MPVSITDADRQNAQVHMLEQRRRDDGMSRSTAFTHKEANPILRRVAMGDISRATPGFVEELFNHGASACIRRPKSGNILKRLSKVDQVEERSDVLLHAVSNCSDEVFQVILSHADQTALNDALPVAISRNHVSKVFDILEAGGDASHWCCKQFSAQVDGSEENMIRVLLRQRGGACQGCRNAGLIRASARGYIRILEMLLVNGADPTFNSGAAFLEAARGGRDDVLRTIISRGQPRLTLDLLDLGVKEAYARGQYRAVELLLGAGAKGPATDDTLLQAVKYGHQELAVILVRHCASVKYADGAAILHAVRAMQIDLVQTLLDGKPSQTTMAAAMTQALDLDDFSATYKLACLFVDAGLRGQCISESLVKALAMGLSGNRPIHVSIIELLLFRGKADVNLHGGKALTMAVATCRKDIISLLLQCHPTLESINMALKHGMEVISEATTRLEIVSMMLDAGAFGFMVDDALEQSAARGTGSTKLTSLLLKRSSVDSNGGRPLVAAVMSRCLDQMKALLSDSPSGRTIAAAWTKIDDIDDDDNFQLAAYELFLEEAKVAESLQDHSLITLAAKGQRAHGACDLLLKNSASPEHLEGAAVLAVAKNLDLDTLKILAQHITSPTIFCEAFAGLLNGVQWLSPQGLEFVSFLLNRQATGPEVDAAFYFAVKQYHRDAVRLLSHTISANACNTAFLELVQHSSDWLAPDDRYIWLVTLLLDKGANGEAVHIAFLATVSAYVKELASENMMDTFLCSEVVDVNYQNGEALKTTVRAGNIAALKTLVSEGISRETMTQTLGEILLSPLKQDLALDFIDGLVGDNETGITPDFSSPFWGGHPAIVTCLIARPAAVKIVKRLIDLGCNPNAEVNTNLYSDEGGDWHDELVPVLAWALSQQGNKAVASSVITTLIKAQANVHFITPNTKTTCLVLAAKYRRGDIVSQLLKMDVDVSVRDYLDRSGLFYAASFGDLELVRSLIKSKSPRNDGSLHEAARNLHSEVVTALITKGKHNPNFRSTKETYGGRSPLQEMVYRCQSTRSPIELESTITALVDGKADVLDSWRGKNAMFLALDNANPYPITQALLDRVMWQYINDPSNVFEWQHPETRARYFMSPTVYVNHGLALGDIRQHRALIQLLEGVSCQDRYYAPLNASQPPGAVGLPEHIQKVEDKRRETEQKRRDREEERQLKLQQEQQEAEHKAALDRQRFESQMLLEEGKLMQKQTQAMVLHEQQLQQKTALHQQQVHQSSELANQQHSALARKHQIAAMAQQHTSSQQQEALIRKNLIAAAAQQHIGSQQIGIEKQKMALKKEANNNQLLHKIKTDNETLRLKRGVGAMDKKKHQMMMEAQQAKERVIKLR